MVTVDLETTSPDPDDARIVSAAIASVGGGEPTESWSTLVNPGVEIPQEAIDVHGITNEMVQADGIPTESAMAAILSILDGPVAHDAGALIAFNARYDLTVADREARRCDTAPLVIRPVWVDPIVIERHLDRYRPKRVASHNLEDCCRVWRVPLEGVAHDATFDAIAAARLAYQLARKGRVIRRVRGNDERLEFIELTHEWDRVRHDLPALFEWQQRIAWDEAVRLEAYFRAGDPRKDMPAQPDRVVAREWPLIPVAERASGDGQGGDIRGVSPEAVPMPAELPERADWQSEAELTAPEWTL